MHNRARVGEVLVYETIDSPRRERMATNRCGASAPERGDLSVDILDKSRRMPPIL